MKILLISDIHANLDALEAVFDAESSKCRGVICLGDITGYGPDPEECVQVIKKLPSVFDTCVILGGNHDAALSGKLPLEWFNGHARSSVRFTGSSLSPESLEWLASLPSTASVSPGVFASHGSPLAPLTGYLWGRDETSDALSWLAKRDLSLCFCGHTHDASVFSRGPANRIRLPKPGDVIDVPGSAGFASGGSSGSDGDSTGDSAGTGAGDRAGFRVGARKKAFAVRHPSPLIINPGSTGFPRSFNGARTADMPGDGLPVSESSYPAYYAVWDTIENTVTFRDARYDRRPVEDRISAKM